MVCLKVLILLFGKLLMLYYCREFFDYFLLCISFELVRSVRVILFDGSWIMCFSFECVRLVVLVVCLFCRLLVMECVNMGRMLMLMMRSSVVVMRILMSEKFVFLWFWIGWWIFEGVNIRIIFRGWCWRLCFCCVGRKCWCWN